MADGRSKFAPGFQLGITARKISIGRATSEQQLSACFAIRHAVFVIEQGVDARLERDSYDTTAIHLLARIENEPAREPRGLSFTPAQRLRRLAVSPSCRKRVVQASVRG
jgi:predicted GNAT family N-acyltransferase